MTAIINELTVFERALLHHSLCTSRMHLEDRVSKTIEAGNSELAAYYTNTNKELTELMNKMFAECFLEDLLYSEQYIKKFSPSLESKNNATGLGASIGL